MSLLKNLRSSFEGLRTNGGVVETREDFSVHAESSRSILRLFQQTQE